MNLGRIRKEKGYTQEKLAKALHVARSTVAMWETSGTSPDAGQLAAMATLLGVSVDEILGVELPLPSNAYPVSNLAHVPIVGAIKCGPGGISIQEVEGYGLEDVKNPEEYILLRVTGDSMEPEIHVGDMALIHMQEDVESGELAAVIVDGDEGTLKRVSKQGDAVILEAFNPAYPARVFTGHEISCLRIVGKVVKTERKW